MNWQILLTSYLLVALAACTNIRREPSSVLFDVDKANRLQEIDLELSRFWNKDWRDNQRIFQETQEAKPQHQTFDRSLLQQPENQKKVQELVTERERLANELSSSLQQRNWNGEGPWIESTFRSQTSNKTEYISVQNLDDFQLNGRKRNPFPLEHRFYSKYVLQFNNFLPIEKQTPPYEENQNLPQKFLKARLECDNDIIHDSGILFFSHEKKSRIYDFNWYYHNVNAQTVQVQFSNKVNYCQFKFYDPEKSSTWTHGFELTDLSRLSTEWIKLTNQIDVCALPTGEFKDKVAGFFWQQDFNFTTCPQSYEKLTNLRDPYASINQKIIALTGAPLRKQDLNEKNPLAPLDFSKAPRFDIIWVSSLNFSADFYGMVLARALRYHGEYGAQIRILVPEVTMAKKDKQILSWLQMGLPNIKVQYYKFQIADGKNGGWIDKFHRVNHTKLVIGYSTTNPAANFLITGGRNIRDSYVFHKAPIYRTFKYLKSYGEGEEPFIFYDDFEIEVRGYDFVKSALAQMLSFWMRDDVSQSFRSTNLNIRKEVTADELATLEKMAEDKPLAKQIMSLPYFDGYQLERFYINMIDSAQKEIIITTPYFRPSLAISEAFDRAYSRGVQVRVVTRIHLAGDGTPQIAEDVNKQGINRHLKNIQIYEWTDPTSIMHAKILVIDKKLSFVSSVNMNRRSFIHDTESGVLVLHKKTGESLHEEALRFLRSSRKITEQERISWINGTLIDWADSYF